MWEPEPCVLDLSDVIRLNEHDLLKIGAANPDLRIEQNAVGRLEIMPPAGPSSSARCVRLITALENWNVRRGGGIVFESSAGFRLPNGALRAPGVSWLSEDKRDHLPPEQHARFWSVVPDFLVEIRSPSDSMAHLRAKMNEWIGNGCRLAWLIDPIEREVHIYRRRGDVETIAFESRLRGEDVLAGFTFDPQSLP